MTQCHCGIESTWCKYIHVLSRYIDLASRYSNLTSPEPQPTLHFMDALLHHPTIHHPHSTSPPRYIIPTIHHPHHTSSLPYIAPPYIIPPYIAPSIHHPHHTSSHQTSSPPYFTPTIYYPLHTSSPSYNSYYLHCVAVANASIYMAIHMSITRTCSTETRHPYPSKNKLFHHVILPLKRVFGYLVVN